MNRAKLEEVMENRYGRLLMQLIAGFGIADHMGDVADGVDSVIEQLAIGIEDDEWSDLEELTEILGAAGVTTVNGTPLGQETKS